MPRTMKLGFHISIKDGLASVPFKAAAVGCQCLQIFSGNPRGWSDKPLDPAKAALFRQRVAAAGLSPVVVHTSYLLNLSSVQKDLLTRSRCTLVGELKRATILGADYVVVHMGTTGGGPEPSALQRMAQSVRQALRRFPSPVTILLENTGGAGGQTGYRLEQLAHVLAIVEDKKRVGICLDTAHLFAAGYDISRPHGVKAAIDEFDRLIGLRNLRLIHLNDSLSPLGSRRDRHAHIGRGFIGKKGIRSILREPRLQSLSAIMETPKKNEKDDHANMQRACRLRDGIITVLLRRIFP
jgi:deoxyribonuclease-4